MIIFSPLFQVYILVLMIALELVKEGWMQDYVVSVITLHFLVPKPGKKVPRDAEL
jgi:hypothetical protein